MRVHIQSIYSHPSVYIYIYIQCIFYIYGVCSHPSVHGNISVAMRTGPSLIVTFCATYKRRAPSVAFQYIVPVFISVVEDVVLVVAACICMYVCMYVFNQYIVPVFISVVEDAVLVVAAFICMYACICCINFALATNNFCRSLFCMYVRIVEQSVLFIHTYTHMHT